MKSWDVIIIGAGIVGLSLALELHRRGLRVLLVDKGEPGREASWAAGGMLVDSALETPSALQALASASARMYPEFVDQLETESGLKIDLRCHGTLLLPDHPTSINPPQADTHTTAGGEPTLPLPASLSVMEPELQASAEGVLFLAERCVDPRQVTAAAITAAKSCGIDFSTGEQVLSLEIADGRAAGIQTTKAQFAAERVVNCAGAWASQIAPHAFPTRPVKGHMLCVAMPRKDLLRHVVRSPKVYLIPRSDGRLVIGATVEEAGFDKQTLPETIETLRKSALELVPRLSDARILEAWAGLRPGTPDALPIFGTTPTPGYFVATGHFRDGILLAPITSKIMAAVITGGPVALDISAFSPARFSRM